MDKLAYSVSEMAEVLGIGRNAAYNLTQVPGFPAIRLSERRVVILVDGLKAWLAQQAEKSEGF